MKDYIQSLEVGIAPASALRKTDRCECCFWAAGVEGQSLFPARLNFLLCNSSVACGSKAILPEGGRAVQPQRSNISRIYGI